MGLVAHRDLEDTLPVRAEGQVHTRLVLEDVGVDCKLRVRETMVSPRLHEHVRTRVEGGTRGRGHDRTEVLPFTRLARLAHREADGRVLTADGRDGVVHEVLAVDEGDIRRPDVAVAGNVDHRAVGHDRASTLPRATRRSGGDYKGKIGIYQMQTLTPSSAGP